MKLVGTWFKMDEVKKMAIKKLCVDLKINLSEFIADAAYAAYLNETAQNGKGNCNEKKDEHETHHV